MAYSIFISHSSEDYDFVQAIRDAARPLGVKVWAFEEHAQPGGNLSEKLVSRIESCSAVLVLLTHAGAASPAVNQEIGVAVKSQKTIIPVYGQGVDSRKFPLLQGLEHLELNTENPTETLLAVTGRVGQLKIAADRSNLIGLAILAGVGIWLANAESA